MPDLDCRIHAQRRAAVRARVSAGNSAKISVSGWLKVFAWGDVLDVVILFIRPCYEIGSAFERFID